MSVLHNVIIRNQTTRTVTLTRPGYTAKVPICSCFDVWGPRKFALGPGESRLLMLEDDDGPSGRCHRADKYISWVVSDRSSGGRIVTYHVMNTSHSGWCLVVEGPAVFAETGGNACLPNMCWVGRPDDVPVQATIYL
jgi:hypothetical protein